MRLERSTTELLVKEVIAGFERIVVFAVSLKNAAVLPNQARHPVRHRTSYLDLHHGVAIREQEVLKIAIVGDWTELIESVCNARVKRDSQIRVRVTVGKSLSIIPHGDTRLKSASLYQVVNLLDNSHVQRA